MGKSLAQDREALVDTTLLLSRASIEHGRTLSGKSSRRRTRTSMDPVAR
jgi:hypothetical protein